MDADDTEKLKERVKIKSSKPSFHRLRYLLYLAGFVDLLAVSLLLPVLTREARKYNASPFAIGLFSSLYGFLQLVSSPLVGLVSDHLGRSTTMLICLFGASCGYLLLGFANSFFFLVLSRFPSGIFKHSQSLARAYLVDITPDEDRSAVFGTFNSISSIGFIVGPIIGGHLVTVENGFSKIAFLSCALFWFNAVLIYTTVSRVELPPTVKPSICNESTDFNISTSIKRFMGTFTSDIRLIPWNYVWDIFLIRFLSSLAIILFRSNFTTVLEFTYNASPKTIGYIISFNSVITMFGGLTVGLITKIFSRTSHVHNFFMLCMHISLILLALSPNIGFIVIFLIPLCISTAVLRACSSAIVYRKASDREVGLLTGISNSTLSVSRMLAPAIGGLCQEFSSLGPGLVAAALAGSAFLFALTCDLEGSPKKLFKEE